MEVIYMERENNLKISGLGSAGGGKFNEVRISGAGSVSGDIECNTFRTSGTSSVNGNVKTKIFESSGASDVKGNVDASEIGISGAGRLGGNVSTGKIKISGAADIVGNLHAENIDISGTASVGGDVEAESFKSSGGFKIGGLLNAGQINIYVYGKCSAKEIGGEKINIRRSNNFSGGVFRAIKDMFNVHEYLVTEVIEGDDIYIESTVAKVVRGNNVTIGPDCDINVVEYKNEIKVEKDTRVKEQKRI
jgi:cytoskeletal protein CcmA (bactofilin family)